MLELIELLERKGKGISCGKIKIGLDNRCVHRKIVEDIAKPNVFAQDSSAQIAQIRRVIDRVPFDVELVLVREYKTPTHSF